MDHAAAASRRSAAGALSALGDAIGRGWAAVTVPPIPRFHAPSHKAPGYSSHGGQRSDVLGVQRRTLMIGAASAVGAAAVGGGIYAVVQHVTHPLSVPDDVPVSSTRQIQDAQDAVFSAADREANLILYGPVRSLILGAGHLSVGSNAIDLAAYEMDADSVAFDERSGSSKSSSGSSKGSSKSSNTNTNKSSNKAPSTGSTTKSRSTHMHDDSSNDEPSGREIQAFRKLMLLVGEARGGWPLIDSLNGYWATTTGSDDSYQAIEARTARCLAEINLLSMSPPDETSAERSERRGKLADIVGKLHDWDWSCTNFGAKNQIKC
jgi:hypothetical protein